MKKIVLVNIPFMRKSTYSISYYRNVYPNLSLAYLAGFLEANQVQIDVIDGKFLNLNIQDVLNRLKTMGPEIIGFTSMTTEIFDVHKLISMVKTEFSGIITILGGVHASALPLETLKCNKDLDIVAVAEGEEILLELSRGVPLKEIKSIYYRENGEIKKTGVRKPGNIKGYGSTAFHLWEDCSLYYVSTYRGCPYSCSFCFKVLGDRIRKRKKDDIMKDIEYAASRRAKLDICDASFGLNREHTVSVLNEIINRKIDVSWSAASRVDIVDEELSILMKKAGCTTIAFGIESGSNRILEQTGKNTSIKKIEAAVNTAKKIGLNVTGYYVFGHPDETKDEVRQTAKMMWKLNTTESIIGIMTPWPGTEVFRLASQNKGGYTLLHKNYSQYDKHYGSAIKFHNFSRRWLEMIRIYSYLNLYIRNFRFLDLFKFLWKRRKNIAKKLGSMVKKNGMGRKRIK